MSRPLLLDLYSGAGGAGEGYHRAGFDVVGVDLEPQPHYPHEFVQADALAYLRSVGAAGMAIDGRPVAAIHASPPCQAFSTITKMHGAAQVATHPDLVEPTRRLVQATGLPYVIENVVGAPLVDPVLLCGTMFGLGVPARNLHLRRHRIFEAPALSLWTPFACNHSGKALQVNGHPGGTSRRDPTAGFGSFAEWREGMGIDWMSADELAEAIPPVYTEWLGAHLLRYVANQGT